jgi:hypothetical protein
MSTFNLQLPYNAWVDFNSVIPANTEYTIRFVVKTSKANPLLLPFSLVSQNPQVLWIGVNQNGNIAINQVDTNLPFPTDDNWHSYTIRTTQEATTVTIDSSLEVTIPSVGFINNTSGPFTIGDADINDRRFYGWFSEVRVYTETSNLVFYANFGTNLAYDLVSQTVLKLSPLAKIVEFPTFGLRTTKGAYAKAAAHAVIDPTIDYLVTISASIDKTSGDTFGLLTQNDGNGRGIDILWVLNGIIQVGNWNTGISVPTDGLFHEYAVLTRPDQPETLFIDGVQKATSSSEVVIPAEDYPFYIATSMNPKVPSFTGWITSIEVDMVQPGDGFEPVGLWDFTQANSNIINQVTAEVGQLLNGATIQPLSTSTVKTIQHSEKSEDDYITASAREYALVVTLSEQATTDVINGANIAAGITAAIAAALGRSSGFVPLAIGAAAVGFVSGFLWASSAVLGLCNRGNGVDLLMPWTSFIPIFPPLGPGGIVIPLPAGLTVSSRNAETVMASPI